MILFKPIPYFLLLFCLIYRTKTDEARCLFSPISYLWLQIIYKTVDMIKIGSLVLLFVSVLSLQITAQSTQSYLSVDLGSKGILALHEIGVEPVHGFLKKNGEFTGVFEGYDVMKIEESTLQYEVIIEDLVKYYQFRGNNAAKEEVFNECFNTVQNYPLPEGYSHGSMGGYYTFDETIAELDQMRSLYPNLISVKTQIGTSIEGRPIYSVKISDNPDISEDEQQVLYTSLHHSSEPCSLQQLIFFMFHILENYGTDPEITYLIDNTEMYFVPAVNPDGYVYNETENPGGGGDWRKNRRPVDYMFQTYYGVDLNRNYGYAYAYDNIGSQPLVWSPWYRGENAFSEPESFAMSQFLIAHDIKLQVNWHAAGNMLIYPWSYINESTPDSLLFLTICEKMTEDNHYRYGNVGETYGYQSNGDADDWSYGEVGVKNKILSMTAEIGTLDDGFWPSIERIDDLCRGAVRLNLNMAHFSQAFYMFDDISPDIINHLSGNLDFTVECVGLDTPSNFTLTFIPLSGNISFQNNTQVFDNMTLLEKRSGQIAYTLDAAYGDLISYIVAGNNGIYTFSDTVTKTYGPVTTLFYDDCETMEQWSGDDFGISNSVFYAGSGSITESPDGNYELFQNSEIVTNDNINLENISVAVLTFKVRFDIENTHDYCEIFVSADNGENWQPLCTKLSRVGSDDQDEGQPVYTGIKTIWQTDEVDLQDYLGESIKIKIKFVSDQSITHDGIYFDEIYVLGIDTTALRSGIIANSSVTVHPNPAQSGFLVHSGCDQGIISSYNAEAKQIYQSVIAKGDTWIPAEQWESGLYFYRFTGCENASGKLIKE